MAIIEKLEVGDLYIQVVDGEDISRTYADRSYVTSCMNNPQYNEANATVADRVKWYEYVKGLQLFRIIDGSNHVRARALIWETKDAEGNVVKVMDRAYPADSDCQAIKIFKDFWHKFADVRKDTKKELVAEIKAPADFKKRAIRFPYLDTFVWASPANTKLYNYAAKGAIKYY